VTIPWKRVSRHRIVSQFNGHEVEVRLCSEGWQVAIDHTLHEEVYPTESRARGAVESAAQDLLINEAWKEIRSKHFKA